MPRGYFDAAGFNFEKCVGKNADAPTARNCAKQYPSMTVEKTVFDYEPRSSCKDWYDSGVRKSGLYIIKLVETSSAFQVYCDMENDGGGWTLVSNFRETSRNCQSNAYGILTSP